MFLKMNPRLSNSKFSQSGTWPFVTIKTCLIHGAYCSIDRSEKRSWSKSRKYFNLSEFLWFWSYLRILYGVLLDDIVSNFSKNLDLNHWPKYKPHRWAHLYQHTLLAHINYQKSKDLISNESIKWFKLFGLIRFTKLELPVWKFQLSEVQILNHYLRKKY